MLIDEAFWDWWENHLMCDPIPAHLTVVQVHHAIQGHPESPRPWEKLIDSILCSIQLQPTKQEPCLYMGILNGHYTLFLRQVDDFAIATKNENMATFIIQNINKHLKLPIHIMGLITRYNGVDVEQMQHYAKIHCGKYIRKMVQPHPWLSHMPAPQSMPLPFPSDKHNLSILLNCPTPDTEQDKLTLEKNMGIKYHQSMGEVLSPMIKCRPNISAHAILLSQYMSNPGEPHYIALKHLIHYLSVTAYVGIHYWRLKPHTTLPNIKLSTGIKKYGTEINNETS